MLAYPSLCWGKELLRNKNELAFCSIPVEDTNDKARKSS
jgi:hypothetical protein